jgi:hypothetical protein
MIRLCLFAALSTAALPALALMPQQQEQQQSSRQEQKEQQEQSREQAPPATRAEQPAVSTSSSTAPRATLDRLELDATAIIGNRELPRVLYIVPWKRSDLGDLTGPPTGSLLDEVLAPVDREVFRRQTGYYEALSRQAETTGSDSSKADNKGSER